MSDILRIACRSTARSTWRTVMTIDPAHIAVARDLIALAKLLDPVAQWRIETRGGRPVV